MLSYKVDYTFQNLINKRKLKLASINERYQFDRLNELMAQLKLCVLIYKTTSSFKKDRYGALLGPQCL